MDEAVEDDLPDYGTTDPLADAEAAEEQEAAAEERRARDAAATGVVPEPSADADADAGGDDTDLGTLDDDVSDTDIDLSDADATEPSITRPEALDAGVTEQGATDLDRRAAGATDADAAGADPLDGDPTHSDGRRGDDTGTRRDDTETRSDATGTRDADVTGRSTRTARTSAKGSAPRRTPAKQQPVVLSATGLVKRYGQVVAVDGVDLEIRQGSIFGVVGPNGAGKTTTLSMITGLLRPDTGSVTVLDHDVWSDPTKAKRSMGVLPDRLRLFDRLTGAQLLYYSATLRGLDGRTARSRSADLARAFDLGDALGRQVADYSVGMAKKIALAATLIHSPRVLVLDEPFESVDPVSAATITDILRRYAAGGGTVILSSHSMELVQRTCDSVAIIVSGRVLAAGTMTQVRGRKSLEDKFVELAGGRVVAEGMEWLHSFSN